MQRFTLPRLLLLQTSGHLAATDSPYPSPLLFTALPLPHPSKHIGPLTPPPRAQGPKYQSSSSSPPINPLSMHLCSASPPPPPHTHMHAQYAYTHACNNTHAHTHTRTHADTHMHAHTHAHTQTYAHTQKRMHARRHTPTHARTSAGQELVQSLASTRHCSGEGGGGGEGWLVVRWLTGDGEGEGWSGD